MTKHAGQTPTALRTSDAASSSSSAPGFSEKPPMIRVELPPWGIGAGALPFSVLSVEKSGDEWFLLILLEPYDGSKSLRRFPARDITINGKSLDRFLEAIATML